MADNRCVRIYDLKQKIKYHPEVGTYISEEDIDLAERVFISNNRRESCCYCSDEYNQEIYATVCRFHTSNNMTQTAIDIKYCPNCGRKLN